MPGSISQVLKKIEALDLSGKSESTVEQRFVTPLLECLGYETHKDYEVFRHSDEGASFKLTYPPVERGAVKVKHYNPDYMPTIRKRAFWIIEAKAPDARFPFADQFITQGLQYCIHPEIQAKYLLITSGVHSAVFDAHGTVFMGGDIFEPTFTFLQSELSSKWLEIFNLLSVDRIRDRIEGDIKAMYDKLALSSLDKTYPERLIRKIGGDAGTHAIEIVRHVNSLNVEAMDVVKSKWRKEVEALDAEQILAVMDRPMGGGETEAHYFVKKSLADGAAPQDLLDKLIWDYPLQSIFRKEQTFVALSILYQLISDKELKRALMDFFNENKEGELPPLNQAECALLRYMRKLCVISLYPELRKRITASLSAAPEIIRFVQPPNALSESYGFELEVHATSFEKLKLLPEEKLHDIVKAIAPWEEKADPLFKEARARLSSFETQIGDFASYGVGNRHYAFKNILQNCSIISRSA